MAKGMRVSGVGKGARRTDLDRAQRVMREAKLQEATGGPRGQRAELTEIASQGDMPITASAVSAMPMGRNIPTVGIFEPTTRLDEPVSAGAGGKSDGVGPEALMTPVDAPDQIAAFARAMYFMNPTPQLRRIVEAFEEEGR